MASRLSGLLVAAALLGSAIATAPPAKPARMGKRTLVIGQSASTTETHSQLLQQLKDRKHDITFKSATERGVELEQYGEFQYDNILLLAPTASDFSGIEPADLVSFVDEGGNLFVAGGEAVSGAVRDLATAFGVDYDVPKARVLDHLSVDASDAGQHTRVRTNAYFPSRYFVGADLAKANAPAVVYEGIGMSVAPSNILASRVLTASSTGYSAIPGEAVAVPQSTGSDTVLVAAVQARNNARAVFTGSAWFLSDAAFKAAASSKGANAAFAKAIVAWACQESGVLRAKNLAHAHTDGSPAEHQIHVEGEKPDLPLSMFPEPEVARNSRVYRIKDDVSFSVDLEVYDITNTGKAAAAGGWAPFSANDVQMEFVMLDPYVRSTLKDNGKGTFSTQFTVPDVYGIYHFRVQYRRAGLSVITLKDQVSVRPFRHNEYERFIGAAYPYYTAAFTMMAGVFVFSYIFLSSAKAENEKKAAAAGAGAGAGSK